MCLGGGCLSFVFSTSGRAAGSQGPDPARDPGRRRVLQLGAGSPGHTRGAGAGLGGSSAGWKGQHRPPPVAVWAVRRGAAPSPGTWEREGAAALPIPHRVALNYDAECGRRPRHLAEHGKHATSLSQPLPRPLRLARGEAGGTSGRRCRGPYRLLRVGTAPAPPRPPSPTHPLMLLRPGAPWVKREK